MTITFIEISDFIENFRPMYCQTKDYCGDMDDPMRVGDYGLEELFKENNVDMAIWAHVHSYQRSFPLFNGTYQNQPMDVYTDPMYPVHVITGNFREASVTVAVVGKIRALSDSS